MDQVTTNTQLDSNGTPAADVDNTPNVQDTTTTMTPVQNDIAKIEAAIEQLKEAGEDLFSEEISNLNKKLVNAKDEIAALAAKAEAETKAVVTEIETIEQTFIQKYGSGTAHTIEIILLAVITAKLLGAI